MKSLVIAAFVAACSHSGQQAVAPPGETKADDPSCPVQVPGTSVTVEDTDDGATLVFVTTGDIAGVRTRAKTLAEAHTRRAGAAARGHAMSDMIATPSVSDESDIDRGARVRFKVTRPDDVATLQSELRMHAQHLATGTCEMAM
jgi:hypothetical protein